MGKIPDNRTTNYRVNTRCIGCCVCSAIAPHHFRTDHEDGVDYVYKQPISPEEERLCAEAMDICPANAIETQTKEPVP